MIKDKAINDKVDKIRLLVLDVDGTLTDGKIYMGNNGEMFKAFDIKDGCGIHDVLPECGVVPVVITARKSDIVLNRCNELGIKECYQGVRNKLDKMQELARIYGIVPDKYGIYNEIAYVGDDIIDIPCMEHCGVVACPNNAVDEVKKISNFISKYDGGNGAVREFIDYIFNIKNIEC